MLRHRSLVMIFTDLLADPEPVMQALRRLRHGGHDVILFHILDEAEVKFPFDGMIEFEEPETGREARRSTPAASARTTWTRSHSFRDTYRRECFQERHRLRAAGHQHAVRQGADRVPDQP